MHQPGIIAAPRMLVGAELIVLLEYSQGWTQKHIGRTANHLFTTQELVNHECDKTQTQSSVFNKQ